MKNRFSKITLLVLSLALVLGVAFAISAGAEGAVKPEIIGKNIAYTDKTAIQIAVDSVTVDASDVKLVVTKADGTEITVTDPDEKTINGKNALVFTLEGIPASAICENVTIVVKSGDNESDAFTYSVAEYFYERLYSDGVINATEGKPLSQKALYERYLSYGAAAQDLFLNYEDGNRVAEPVTLVDNYNVVAINNGVLDNGNEVMISPESFSTTVTANDTLAADKTFTGKWTVTTYGETVTTETVEDGATVTANGIVAVTPIYTDATGKYFLSDLSGLRHDYDVRTTLPDISYDGVKDGEGNVTKTGSFEIVDGALHFEDGDAENAQMVAKFWQGYPSSYNVTVFEFDFKLNQSYGTSPLEFKVSGNSCILYQTKDYDSSYGTGYKLCAKIGSSYIPTGIDYGTWGNIRLEHYFAEDMMKIFVNNVYLGEIAATSNSATSPLIYLTANERKSGSNADLYVDNVFVGHFTADKIPYVAGDPNVAN